MTKIYPDYHSDEITELTFSISTIILSGKGWRLIARHELDHQDDAYSSSSIVLEMLSGRKMREVFQIYYDAGVAKPTASFISRDWKGYNAEQIASITIGDIKLLLANKDPNYELGDISDANQIITCEAIPIEVREWIIMNGVNSLGLELDNARSKIRRLAKTTWKKALADKLEARKI